MTRLMTEKELEAFEARGDMVAVVLAGVDHVQVNKEAER